MTGTTIRAARNAPRAVATVLVFVLLVVGASFAPATPSRGDNAESLFGNYLAARHAVLQRDTSSAAEFYRNALRRDPGNDVILERAFLLQLSSGDVEGARTLAERLIEIDPAHRIARLTLGVSAMRARQFNAARRHFARADDRGPIAEITSAFLIAWSHQGSGDTDAALKALDTVKGAEWYQIYKAYHAGLIADLAGRDRVARARLGEALELDGSALRVAETYARFLARKGQTDQARAVLDTFERNSPDHPMMTAVRTLLDEGRTPGPVVASVAAGAAESLYSIGAALTREGGEDLSVVYLQLALYLAPDFWLPLLSLANVHEAQSSHDLAVQAYRRIPDSSPLKRNATIQMALNLNALERPDEAVEVLEELVRDDPADIGAITALGNVLRSRERFEDAARIYTTAIDQVDADDARHWTLFYYRGICHERAKQWPQAEADLSKALEMNPDDPLVLNYLGYSWIDQGVHLDKALEMIKQAVARRPDDGYIVDSLGWAYYRLGDYESAVRELERAVELRPEDPVINDHLGDAYWRVGRKLEATFQWSHARALKPEPAEMIKIEAKLKHGLDAPNDRASAAKADNRGG